MHTRFIELAGEINTAMPAYVVQKTADALNEAAKPLKGSRILVLGIAYKKNVDDMRESPSVELMELLRAKGAEVAYSDPFFPAFPPMRRHAFSLNSVALTAETLASFDAVILATDHDNFDYPLIEAHSPLLVDTRGRFAPGTTIVRA
jgi:UDP-N-acetyl-D-glucosamine dehydrogenase